MPTNAARTSKFSGQRKPSTIIEVAERAGVSTATVSRVISGSVAVSKALETRVKNAIEELDFRPNLMARRLRRRNTNMIGVVVSDIQNPFNTALVEGVESVLQNDYLMLLGNTSDSPRRERQKLNIFLSEDVTGIIFACTNEDASYFTKFQEKGVSLVAVDRKPTDLNVDSVKVANEDASFRAVNHFLQEGHQRIGFVAGPAAISTARERCGGYVRGLASAGLPALSEWIQAGNFRQDGGYHAMGVLLDLPNPPTAVLVANNLMTLGALQMIHERGLSIPGEIALIGFDDMPWAASLRPPLTVVAQPVFEMGAAAARLLLARIENYNAPVQNLVFETQLIIRASCSCQGGIKKSSPQI
jgi:DNA-binding LacI/PurR family transcriptional regulator